MFQGFSYEIHIVKALILKPHLDFSPWMGGDDPTQRRAAQDWGLCSPRRPCSSPDQPAAARIRALRRGAPAGLLPPQTGHAATGRLPAPPPPAPNACPLPRLAVTFSFPGVWGFHMVSAHTSVSRLLPPPGGKAHRTALQHTSVPHQSYLISLQVLFHQRTLPRPPLPRAPHRPCRQPGRAWPPC